MSERLYPLNISRSHLCGEIQVTAEQAEKIGCGCAEIKELAAKEAAKPKEGDVGTYKTDRALHVSMGGAWWHIDGTKHDQTLGPIVSHFNLEDLLGQGPIVIGLTEAEARNPSLYINEIIRKAARSLTSKGVIH